MAGLDLDPWQQFVLVNALGERKDGKWAAFEVGIGVARQNGKGGVLEARELAGLFLLGERLLIHSAHEFATSLEAFHRLLSLVEGCPDFVRRVKRVSRAHGEEGIELKGGQRIRFRTRTKGGGRGFSADWVALDEAMHIPEAMHGALLPTLSARPNPQVWYTGSAVDQDVMEHGVVFSRVRDRGVRGDDPALAYFEWSVPREHPDDVSESTALDPEAWGQANPGLGIRISAEHVAREQRSMDPRTFAVERLGVGDWPATVDEANSKIDMDAWRRCADRGSKVLDPVCLAFDVTPSRTRAAIAAAGLRADGKVHGEVIEHRRGTGWVIDRLMELEAHSPVAIVCDGNGPAASLLIALGRVLKKEVTAVSSKDHARACGALFDLVEQDAFRHLDTDDLTQAVRGAATRPLGDAWAWARKDSHVDISPLVAVTLAVGGFQSRTSEPSREVVFL